jgi:DNA-binding XRE family transcriptional regulator
MEVKEATKMNARHKDIFRDAESTWNEADFAAARVAEQAVAVQAQLVAIGIEIRNARKAAGLNQTELGALARISQEEISRIEKARVSPRLTSLLAIGIALRTDFRIGHRAPVEVQAA